MTRRLIAVTVVLFVACGPSRGQVAAGAQAAQATPLPTGTLDELLAPIALYPDSLLAQMLMSATDPAKITELDKWLKANQNAERHAASGRRGQGRVRCELRGVGALPSSRGEDGGPDRVDEGPGAGVHVRSRRRLCQHSEIEAAGEERRHPEEFATAGGRNQENVIRPGSDRHRAHQSADRLRPAIQHPGGVHAGSDDGGRRPGRQ